MHMRVYRLFVISTCRFQYLAENQTKLEENLKDVGFRGTHGTCFILVCVVYKKNMRLTMTHGVCISTSAVVALAGVWVCYQQGYPV